MKGEILISPLCLQYNLIERDDLLRASDGPVSFLRIPGPERARCQIRAASCPIGQEWACFVLLAHTRRNTWRPTKLILQFFYMKLIQLNSIFSRGHQETVGTKKSGAQCGQQNSDSRHVQISRRDIGT